MTQYIELDTLVKEIENLESTYKKCPTHNSYEEGLKDGRLIGYKDALDKINTLEVKKVDLKEEIDNYFAKEWEGIEKEDNPFYDMIKSDLSDIAKHFFELGIKAQHDNWKVVDNINLPQADRNKIYCVLSKNKYLLARVIEHPQDDDLLQWKCTEFPHHRYDMCEGDKYMQIV